MKAVPALLGLLAAAGLAWVAFETIHAGSDVPPPAAGGLTQLSAGSAGGRRIDGRAWSLDYERATMSADGSIVEIEEVRHGTIDRDGKPFAHMRAHHVSANVAAGDFTVDGPVEFEEIGGNGRTLTTTAARYVGAEHLLVLDRPTTIHEGGLTLSVEHATIDFRTGETKLGRIVGRT